MLIGQAVALEKEGSDLRAAQRVAEAAAVLAEETGSARAHALALDQAGVAARRRGQYSKALRYYDKALKVARESRCPQWLLIQIRSHRAIALDYLGRRRLALREHHAVAAYERRVGDLRGYAKSLNNIALVHLNEKRWSQAIPPLEESCALKRQLNDPRGIAQSLHNLGKIYFLSGDHDRAEHTFLESLRIRRGAGRDQHGVAQSLVALAHVALEAGREAQAQEYAEKAREAHSSYGDRRGVTQANALLRTLKKRRAG